jgi:GNAT superfamily N-acetyltransferase
MTNRQNGVAPSAIQVATAAQVAAVAQGFQAFVSAQHPLLVDESADLPLQLVITEANRVIAGVLGRVFWQGLEIEVLWVDEAHRQRGLGRRLLQQAEDHARAQGTQVTYLRIAQAAAFHERCGYRHCGYLPRPLETGLHRFHKELG